MTEITNDESNVEEVQLQDEQQIMEELAKENQVTENTIPEMDNNVIDESVYKKQVSMLMKQMRDMLGMLEAQWNSTKQEFKLTDSHMQQLYAYNTEHAQLMSSDLSPEEAEAFDHFNGLNSISEEKVLEIFGEEHPIIGVQHDLTVDRIKSVVADFFGWMSHLREYQNVHNAYTEYLETEEEKQIDQLKKYCEEEQDQQKKDVMQKSIDLYYNRKNLDFLAEPLSEETINILIKAFYDEKKIQYWIERSRDKLKQLKVSSKFILEISQFEKRFLLEEYHKQSNIFLLYFMNLLVYSNISDSKNDARTRIACIVYNMDAYIRNALPEERKEKIHDNMIKFQKQFMDKIGNKEEVQK